MEVREVRSRSVIGTLEGQRKSFTVYVVIDRKPAQG